MTREIVHSDIVFARGLLEAGCGQSGIVTRLCLRGVARDNAARLVQSLQYGQPIRLQSEVCSTAARRHRSAYHRAAGQRRHRHERRSSAARNELLAGFRRSRKRHSFNWYVSRAFATGIVALGVVCFGYVLYEGYRAWPREPNEEYNNWLKRAILHERGLPVPPSDDLKKLPVGH